MTQSSAQKKRGTGGPTSKLARAGWICGVAIVLLAIVVLIARWLVSLDGVVSWMHQYPGRAELPANTPVGFPPWLGWQHYLNLFFLVLIVRSGWRVRTVKRPPAHWMRNNTGLIRTKGKPFKISLDLWFHLSLDVLWVVNGIIFMVLLFATGQYKRIVPASWDVFPNAASAALQYASLNWPAEQGWVNYNALQLLAYFSIVFIAAPIAIITGLRMSAAWPRNATTLNKIYPVELARLLHFPTMIYFVAFTVVHVALVFATGFRNNLNHMFASNNSAGWGGFIIFAISIVVIVGFCFLAQPIFLRPVAALTGKVSK